MFYYMICYNRSWLCVMCVTQLEIFLFYRMQITHFVWVTWAFCPQILNYEKIPIQWVYLWYRFRNWAYLLVGELRETSFWSLDLVVFSYWLFRVLCFYFWFFPDKSSHRRCSLWCRMPFDPGHSLDSFLATENFFLHVVNTYWVLTPSSSVLVLSL